MSFICGAIQAASRLGAEQSAKLCAQYLAPIVKNRQYNFLPLGQNLFVGAQARPNEITYSEDWMRPDYIPPTGPTRRPHRRRPPRCRPTPPARRGGATAGAAAVADGRRSHQSGRRSAGHDGARRRCGHDDALQAAPRGAADRAGVAALLAAAVNGGA